MIKKAPYSIDFDFQRNESEVTETTLDFLPCTFKPESVIKGKKENAGDVNQEHNQVAVKCDKEVFFDPCIKEVQGHDGDLKKEVSIQGRKLVSKALKLSGYDSVPQMNYSGRVLALQRDEINPCTLERQIKMAQLHHFDSFNVWQKDKWIESDEGHFTSEDTQRHWAQDMHQYLMAQAVLHDDSDLIES